MLRDMKPKSRKQWVVRRWGKGAEKRAMTLGKYPAWADSAVNQINWEDK